MRADNGFTLQEVLVALAVLVLALAALWNVLSQGIAVADAFPDRVLAPWVAHNRVVLHQATHQWPDPQVYKGSAEMAGKIRCWEEEVSATSESLLRRITVKVGVSHGSLTLATQEGFIQQPEKF